MPTPASLAIARIDGSASAEANKRVATTSSCSRLRVASARGLRISSAVKADHAPVVLGWVTKRIVVRLRCLMGGWSRQVTMIEPGVNTSVTTSRAVQFESFGGPDALSIRVVPAPQAGPGQIRVRVTAAGLNPMDWFMTSDAETATRFGLRLPCGFGTDYAGVVDQVGDGVSE